MQSFTVKSFPLSLQQTRLWSMYGEHSAFHAQCAVLIDGSLHITMLHHALQQVAEQHEILHTVFDCLPGMDLPVQIEAESLPAPCPVIDLTKIDTMLQDSVIDAMWEHYQSRPFDLVRGPLIYCTLLHLAQNKYLLLLRLSAFAADTTTLRAFVHQLSQTYTALHNQHNLTDEEPLQYADISAWQNDLLQEDEAESHKAYWNKQKVDQAPTLHLPGEKVDLTLPFNPATCSLAVDTATSVQIVQVAQEYHVTPAALALACWQLLIERLSTTPSFIVGIACDGRYYEELADALGLYIRYVPMSATFEYDQPFAQVLATVHRSLEEAKKRQYYFVANAEDVPPFPISFTSEQWPEAFPAAGDVRFQLFRRSGWQEPFLIQLSLLEMGTQIQLELHYDQSRLEAATVQRWAAGLQRLLDVVLAIPTTALSQLPTIGKSEAQWLDLQLQGERLSIPADPWHALFERQVTRTPKAPALQSGQQQWSYQQLNAQANQLAHFLQAQGVSSGTLVGMCFPRGGQMIVALLAILKAGGTYVPFEPEQPAARLAYMTQQTQMPFLLTLRKVASSLPLPSSWSGTLLCLDEIDTSLQTYPQDNLPWQGSEQDPAYVIYTSGSTGRPKGVMVRHRNLLNYTQGLLTRMQAQAGWHFATVSTLAADLGNSAIFGALGSGGCLHVFDYETITQATAFAQAMHEQRIDVLKIVPTHLSSLLAALPEDEQRQLLPRQRLLLGGERVSGQLRSRLGALAGTCRVYNHYGPTETTIGVLMGEMDLQEEGEEVPLGRPLANSWCLVLDRWGQPVPQGVVGELYIGGAGVTAGYLADQAQNQERFVSLTQRPGERVYRTGDLVRMRADGQLVFVGRRDSQVKLRGYRIELAEIEAVLGAHPQIRESVVLMREDEPDTPFLAAYLVARKRPEPSEEEIMQYARTHLPTPMLPSTLTWLPTLPLTSNGKIDRQKLPRPTRSMHNHAGSDAALEVAAHQPRTLLEELMQAIWQEVLKLPIPDVQESFFNMGGHSLLATQVVSRVRLAFGVDLSIVDFFAEPTIAGTARQVEIALQGGNQEQTPGMQRASREHPLPLSFAQQRLWFLDQLDPTNTAYNKSISLQLVGELNRRALEQSLQTIISRHEVLRTIFEMHQAQPVQVIQPITCFQLVFIDLSGLPTQEAAHLAQQLAKHEGQQIFNLAHDLPVRTRLIKLNETEHHLVLTLHHIASDAWSNGIFVRELNTFYAAAVKTTAISVNEPLPAISLQYADFAAWQRSWLQGQVLEEKVHYWREQLEGLVPSELPTDRPRSQSPTFRGARYALSFSPELTAEIRKLSQKEGVTLFMTLLASFQLLLARYTQETDIAVGTPIANRHRAEIEHLIGFFVNTLVLRTDLSGSPSFRELLKRVRSMTLRAYAHQDVPFEKLVELLQPERDLSRSPLFNVLFSLQNVPMPSNELPGLQVHISENENRTTKFDLSVDVIEHEQSISCIVEYFTDLFDQATITRMLTHWQQLLQHIITDPEQSVDTISMLSEQELHQMLVDWNATAVEQVSDPGFQPRFELVAKEKADHIAIALDDTYLTYEKLNQRANQLAHLLQSHGVGPEVLVGVYLPRSLESILALLAILKAGGAYLPLDPDLPAARLSFLLQDAACSLVLSHSTLSLPLPPPSPPMHQTLITRLDLDRLGSSLSALPPTAPYSPVLPTNLAYMIYTSGSTGTPKGVAVTHQGIGNLASAQAHTFALSAHSRELQFASLSFDASVSEIMMALLSGATLYLASQQQLLPGPDLLRLLHEQAITHLTLPPSALAVLPHEENSLPDLQTLIVAGEACDPDLMSVWATTHHFFNAYGPTETTVCASIAACLPHEPLSIGRPIAQTQLYVLDAHLQPVPIGVTGELYIGGIGLARGYHQRADLTAERFVPHPFSTLPGQRLYRSGDRVRYRADGSLEYLGRLDEQVKLRGYRIEPGEIEQLIRQIPGVQSCVVLLQEHEGLGKQLVAYLVPAPGQNPSSDAIRLALREKVPPYLIPSFFIILEALPITTTGKVDRQALLAFTPAWSQSSETEGRQEEPLTPIEELVMMVWREVMHVPQLTRTSNFFALGGHSLLATQIAARIQTLVQISLPVRTLFEAPTIVELAERIEQISRHEHGVNLPPLEPIPHAQSVTLSFAQQRMWFLQQLEPHSSHYNLPMVMRLYGALNTKALERSLIEIICRHDSLRTTFKMVDGNVVQFIEPTAIFQLRQCDLRRLTTPEREVVARNLIEEDVERPFALDQKPPLRGILIRLDTNEHILVVIMHHIISDGWSNSLFLHELTTLYPTFQRNMPAQLPALKAQYADFALWQHAWLQGDVLDRQLDYWKQQLQNATTLALPTDRPRPLVQSHEGAREVFVLPTTLSDNIKSLSQRMGVTLFMTLLSSFYVLLYRYTDQEDLLVGTPIANRHLAATESIIGFFVNTLVMRANLAGNPTFEALLTQVREIALAAYTHQDAPFEKVVETVQPERDLSRTPLFQVLFTLQNFSSPDRDFGGIHAESLEILSKNARFDLTLSVLENEQGLRCEMGYNRHLFDPGTIVRMSHHWQTLLQDCVARSGCAISDLTLLTPEEHRLLLQGNRQPSQIQPSSLCLHTLIEQRVERILDTVAVVCADQQLTYHALNTLANQVANLLRQRGVGPEIPVGICLPPSPLLIVTVLAVLKAGGMYIPLDPAHPRERLARILQDAQASLVVTQRKFSEIVSLPEEGCFYLDQQWDLLQEAPGGNPESSVQVMNAAYVLYTSGSTGTPKGVMVEHRALLNYVLAASERGCLEKGVYAMVQPFTVDSCLTMLFPALLTGGVLQLFSKEEALDVEFLVRSFTEAPADYLKIAPSHLAALLSEEIADKVLPQRTLIVGGEASSWEWCTRVQARMVQGSTMFSNYGPTETTVGSQMYQVQGGPEGVTSSNTPLGAPLAQVEIYVLDAQYQIVPIGVVGELYIGGAGLARGYLRRPDITAERFLPHPFGQEPGARLYKTGDLVRWHADGNLEFVGRRDEQIKIRGNRIELGEIEATL
ncbi:non-ribosomal peptide synthetase, partial [Dictyobacter formicarum]|uniref:non-ribosomal peptide synthetase n=1 Tax=Dictyobacter formicarum TaxID=2778368 RepID=UPI0019150AB0